MFVIKDLFMSFGMISWDIIFLDDITIFWDENQVEGGPQNLRQG